MPRRDPLGAGRWTWNAVCCTPRFPSLWGLMARPVGQKPNPDDVGLLWATSGTADTATSAAAAAAAVTAATRAESRIVAGRRGSQSTGAGSSEAARSRAVEEPTLAANAAQAPQRP